MGVDILRMKIYALVLRIMSSAKCPHYTKPHPLAGIVKTRRNSN